MAEIQLRDYQLDALAKTTTAEAAGCRRQLGVAATGLGKALASFELVLTPEGWRPIGDLAIGDEVIGVDGNPTTVEGVFPQGVRRCYEMTFSDGPIVSCDADHLWTVRTKYDAHRDRPWRTMTTAELLEHGVLDNQGGKRWEIPRPAAGDDYPEHLPLDPYLLGILLGDGGLSTMGCVKVHTEDELVATIDLPSPAQWARLSDCGTGGIAGNWLIGGPAGRGANPVLAAVRALGLEGSKATDKTIPEIYKLGAPSTRLAVLQGIMDADGHVRPADGHVEITLANYQLCQDVAHLVRSLGGTARIHEKKTTWTHNGENRTGVAWRASIAIEVCPFRWERKASVWRPRTKYPPRRSISSINPHGDSDMVCIKVADPDGLFITRGYVVTHNTIMFSALARQRGGRTLILAHRDELVTQAAAKVAEVWPAARVGVVKAGQNHVGADVVVASVQTLARPRRMAQLVAPFRDPGMLSAAEPFGLVVVDEAHHATADTYRTILVELHAGQPDGPLLLGVTATPDRGDGQGLHDLFDEIVWTYDILWGIGAGYLSDLRGIRVRLDDLDLSKVKVSRGDYAAGASGRALEEADAPGAIVHAWLEHAKDRRTLVFTPTVALAEAVAAEFVGAGIRSGFVSGKTPIDDRRRILRDYAAGDIQVLANCAVLTEGFDEPRTDCIVMARPTKSRALYAQAVGRGTRRHPDKTDCLVLDVVGVTDDHTLLTIPSLFGLDDKDLIARATNGSTPVSGMVREQAQRLVTLGRITAEEAELFTQVREQGGIAWVAVHRPGEATRYECRLGMDRHSPRMVIGQATKGEHAGQWIATVATPPPAGTLQMPSGTRWRILHVAEGLELVQGVAEDYIRKNGEATVHKADAPWRRKKPSKKQLGFAAKLHIRVDPGWNAGQVGDAIDVAMARRTG